MEKNGAVKVSIEKNNYTCVHGSCTEIFLYVQKFFNASVHFNVYAISSVSADNEMTTHLLLHLRNYVGCYHTFVTEYVFPLFK